MFKRVVKVLESVLSNRIEERKVLMKEKAELFFMSSPDEFVRFEQGAIWQDMKRYLTHQIITLRDEITTAREHKDIIHMQGELYRLMLLLDLPKLMPQIVVEARPEEKDDVKV